MQGYLVQLGNDQLGSGDVIVGPTIGFNQSSVLGTGSWTWTGVYSNGTTYTNINDTGTYYLATDGNVYFVPDNYQVDEVISATATSAPSSDFREFGTSGNDTDVSAGAEDDVLYGGTSTSATGTGDDTIHAGAGDDTAFGGDGSDTIIGSGGADSIDGGTGADTIYGDNDSTVTSQSESLNWSAQGADGADISGGFVQDTGSMNVSVNFNADGSGSGDKEVATRTQYTESGEPFADNSALFLQGDGGANTTVSMIFNAEEGTGLTDEVSNISFRLNDVDIQSVQWVDVVTVNAYDINGNAVAVTLTAEGDDVVNGQTVTGTGSGADNPDLANGSVLVDIAGPVHSIEVIYSNSVSSGNQFLWVTDVHFDTVVDPDGADSITGGAGADLIYGGGDNDTIAGDDDSDSIFGGTGDDTLNGGNQADTMYGGADNDTVDGDAGADTLFGDAGDDTLRGDGGNDTLTGGTGNDTLFGGNNNDSLYGGSGNDNLNGGNGNDVAFGGSGNDTVNGDAGNDSLNGDAGDDTVSGGTGNDTISGGAGDDALFGGTGDDQFNISDNHDQDTITGGEDAGDGDIDTVSFSNSTSSQGIDVTYTGDEAGTYDYDGTTGTGSFVEIERVETTAFDDTIDGGNAPGGITVDAGAGDDSIIGGNGADSIDAGTGADTIEGGAGDDSIDLGGPDGDPDLLVFSDGDGTDTVANFDAPIDNLDGTFTGIDKLDVSDLNDLGGDPVNTNDVTVSGPSGGPTTLTFPNGEQIILQGITPAQLDSPFALEAIGIPLPDGTVSGGAGDDLIDGSYLGDPDGDIVDNDDAILPGDTANDDLIEANGGNDSVLAGDGDDEIYGGTGNDTIDGGVDDDTIFGEAGDDTAVVTANFGDDTYTGGETGETTGDKIDATALAANTTVVFSGAEAGTLTQGTNSVDFTEVERVETGSGDDNIFGGTGNDSVDTGAGDDTVFIADNFGDDTFNAGEVDDASGDVLDGAALSEDVTVTFSGPEAGTISNGSDTADFAEFEELATGSGDDTVFGGTGNDSVSTNAGDDIIAISDNFGNDTFDGGAAGQTAGDRLDGSALTGDATVDFTGSEEGQLSVGSDTADFSEIEVVATGSGDDIINSGAGNDTVETNEGDDTFVVTSGFGDDSFTAGEGGETDGDDVDATALNTDAVVTFSGPEAGVLTNGGDSLTFEEVELVATGGGDDTIFSGSGNDTVETNGGDDSYVVTNGFGEDSFTAGEGSEVAGDDIDATAINTDTTVDFSGPEAGTLSSAGDTLDFAEVEQIATGSGDDTILSGTGDDTVSTNGGDDTFVVSAGFGDDSFTAGETGETDGDVVDATALAGDTTVTFSGPEAGTLAQGGNTLNFTEVEGVETGSGDDDIISGTGDDSVSTNAGDDTFVISDGFGNDTFDAGEGGETNGDTLDGSALTDDATVNLSGPEAGTLTTGADTVTFTDVENIITGSGDDTVTGGAGDENVSTGAGNDTVSGGEGSDTFDTGAGDDTITFAEGDSITSGSGDDTFTLEDLGETGNGPINIDGGDEDSATGDTLALGDLADLSTLVTTDDGTGSLSGSVTLDDGTLLTFTDIETVICFTPGTLIATPQGARDIATLKVGDPVLTRDHGIQAIRWIESRTVKAQDNFAPIRIRPGVLTGQQDDLLVSPQHRMLFQGYRAELLFGETEVLVAAKQLVDGKVVTEEHGGTVTYIHMMFDQHEVVYANGAASESFHPGSVGLTGITEAAREELFTLFPELRSDPAHYGQTARRCLKSHESNLLRL